MPTDANADPYETVLADLRAKRDQISNAIVALESLRPERGVPAQPGSMPVYIPPLTIAPTSDEFVGVTIVEGAKALLTRRGKALGNVEIATAFVAGGMNLNSADPTNTVGSVITRRFNQVGDIVRVGRGLWGLPEWYPGRTFVRKPVSKGAAIPTAAEMLGEDDPIGDATMAAVDGLVQAGTYRTAPRGHAVGARDGDTD